MNGIEKDIDSLGRVVIPIKFRKRLGIQSNSKVIISLENGTILISPARGLCALCGKKVEENQKLRLCGDCVSKIKSEHCDGSF